MRASLVIALALVMVAVAHAHVCMHDHLQDLRRARLGQSAFEEPGTALDYEVTPGSPHTRGFHYKNLRIHVDYSFLESDSKACLSEGGFVERGSPAGSASSEPRCVEASDTNCYIECTAAQVATSAKQSFVQHRLVPAATDFLSTALKVIPVSGNLTVSSSTCSVGVDSLAVPSKYLSSGVGVPADIIVLATMRPTVGGLVAYAGACETDTFNRPIMAHVNFGPEYLPDTADAQVARGTWGTVVHEIMHALGFTKDAYNTYLDVSTNGTLPTVKGATVDVTGTGGTYTYEAINSPTALAEARSHYGCSSLAGVPLEQQGGEGTATSHWEKRLMWNEIMTGTSSINPAVSRLTLAFFEDMGWYQADYAAAEYWTFGKDAGCAFIEEKCVPSTSGWTSQYICDTHGVASCNYDRSSRSVCNLADYASSGLASEYSYFSDPDVGGVEIIADYCPMWIDFTNGLCTDTANADATNDPYFGAVYSATSMCFDSTIGNPSQNPIRCYRSACTAAGELTVLVGAEWYTCTASNAGTSSGAEGLSGQWTCPPAEIVSNRCGGITSFPSVTGISPASVGAAGGEAVTVTGSGFVSGASYTVAVGPSVCGSVSVDSETQITCTMQPLSTSSLPSGTRDVVVIHETTFAAGALVDGAAVDTSAAVVLHINGLATIVALLVTAVAVLVI